MFNISFLITSTHVEEKRLQTLDEYPLFIYLFL